MANKVAVLGGGVAGLSVAHELCERGFQVDVYEVKDVAGGKARTIYKAGSGTGGRSDLPGEHGFRFFPGFYQHLPDTMKRIPFAGQPNGVFDNLVQAKEYLMATAPGNDLVLLARFPQSISDWLEAITGLFNSRKLGIPAEELAHFISRILVILTSCQERRLAEYEKISWWNFVGAAARSTAYQLYLAKGLTRSLVALKAEEGSTRTVGDILIQLLLDVVSPTAQLDRLLNGPTTEVWIKPWLDYLAGRGVNIHYNAKIKSIQCTGGSISKVTVDGPGMGIDVTADYYVAAMPVEQLVPLITAEMISADPTLDRIQNLRVAWMNGIQFFIKADAEMVKGHANFVAEPWALTGISQAQFWKQPLSNYGDGSVNGVLSVDVSDWEEKGIVYHQPAKKLHHADQIKTEVLAQLRAALSPALGTIVDDANIATYLLDTDITFPNPSGAANLEPLLINTIDSWQNRPEAVTAIPNLFLAADYVRTFTDLATMEGVNEAARRAVNGILAASGSSATPCQLWPLHEPAVFAPARLIDKLRFDAGLPHATLGTLAPGVPPLDTIEELFPETGGSGPPPPPEIHVIEPPNTHTHSVMALLKNGG